VDLTSCAVEVEGREGEDDGFECPPRNRGTDWPRGEERFLQLLGEETAGLAELANKKRFNRFTVSRTVEVIESGLSPTKPSGCELPTTLGDSRELGKQHSSTKHQGTEEN
jgi:hypothetical protein